LLFLQKLVTRRTSECEGSGGSVLYLISGNGGPNFGDELITLDWIKYYRDRGYRGDIFVDCKSANGASKLHHDLKNVKFGRFLKALTTGKDGTVSSYIRLGREFIDIALGEGTGGDAGRIFSNIPANEALADVKPISMIHLVGGGYINGAWKNSFSLLGGASQLARKLNVPVIATGLGLAPLAGLDQQDSKELKLALADFSFFEVRDERSMKLLDEASAFESNISLGLDDSFLNEPRRNEGFDGSTLHVSLFDKHLSDKDQRILEAVRGLAKEFDRVAFWQCNSADKKAGEIIAAEIPSTKILFNRPLLYTGLPIRAGDLMITSRFHPHLLASRLGIGGAFLVQSDFYDSKHGSVVELGSAFTRYRSSFAEVRPSLSSSDSMLELDKIRVKRKRIVADRAFNLLSGSKVGMLPAS